MIFVPLPRFVFPTLCPLFLAGAKLGKVEVMKGLRVVNYDGSIVRLTDGTSLPAATLIWTAG
jgi:hypothetical protein